MLKPLEDCNFRAIATRDGKFVGRVKEFPDLRSRPQKSSLDAVDEIITLTRDKIAALHAAKAGLKAAPLTARP
jgi:hypothetical protein